MVEVNKLNRGYCGQPLRDLQDIAEPSKEKNLLKPHHQME